MAESFLSVSAGSFAMSERTEYNCIPTISRAVSEIKNDLDNGLIPANAILLLFKKDLREMFVMVFCFGWGVLFNYKEDTHLKPRFSKPESGELIIREVTR